MFWCCWQPLIGQTPIETAINKEDLNGLVSQFHTSVEVFVLSKESSGIEKSERLIANFFNEHDVQSFRKRHSGTSKGGSSNYAIGELSTDRGKYRVSIYYFVDNNGHHITELRIEE